MYTQANMFTSLKKKLAANYVYFHTLKYVYIYVEIYICMYISTNIMVFLKECLKARYVYIYTYRYLNTYI